MQPDSAFECFEFVQADGIFVARAREKATGREAQCHFFPGDKSGEASQIGMQLMSLPEAARGKIIKFGQNVFFTEPLPGGASIRSWIATLTNAPAPSPSAAPAADEPGEFTQFFTASEIGSGNAAPPPPPVAAAPKAKIPGEFTRMYTADEVRSLRDSAGIPPRTPAPPTTTQIPVPPAPSPEGPLTSEGPGLKTFLGMKAPSARTEPFVPPPPARVNDHPFPKPQPPTPPPPPRAPVSEPEPFGGPDLFAPTPPSTPAPPPRPAPLPPPRVTPRAVEARPRAGSSFDPKVALIVMFGLIALGVLMILIQR